MMDFLSTIGSNTTFITYIVIGASVIAGLLIYIVWRRMSDLIQIYKQKKVFIEITPPRDSITSPQATEQFFHIFHNLGATKHFRHKVLGRSKRFSLEVSSTKRDGIRYIVVTSERDAEIIERNIAAFMKGAKIKRIDDPLLQLTQHTKVKEFRQTKHFALSIRTVEMFDAHDPIAYIHNAMDKLAADEQVMLQLVISPAKVRNMAGIVQRYHEYYKVSESTHNKAYSHLHRTDLRIRVVAKDDERLKDRLTNIESAITSFGIPKVQTLKARYNFPQKLRGQFREWAFAHRMPSLIHRSSSIFSSLELAHFYHFPTTQYAADSLEVTVSPTLAPPLSIINATSYDSELGVSIHRGKSTPIGLNTTERERHVFITGGTGNGKTTLLKYAIAQDIQKGKGVAVIDPHGDMAESLLGYIPKERMKDVIYFNPDDLAYPIGLNLLELTPGLSDDDCLREKELVTESVISIFRKIFSDDDSGGHRIEYVLRNTIHTALTIEGATLFTIYDLLNDPKYRRNVVKDLENKDLKNFWRNELGKAGGMQQIKMIAGITAKIGRFLFSASAKRIFEQRKSTINFDEILDGKILICNFSKGLIGEDSSELFGIATLAKLQLAALHRARMPEETRKPFYLYVDEFQNFATPSFIQMLSEGRKYKLYIIMAEQSTSQQRDKSMVDVILANAGTVISFRSGNPTDERILLPLFRPYLQEGDIANLSSRNFYIRISAVTTQKPFSGETLLIEGDGSEEMRKRVIQLSRERYAKMYVNEDAATKSKSDNPTQEQAQQTTQNLATATKLKAKRKARKRVAKTLEPTELGEPI
jgi:hypothetical protein